MVLTDDMKKEVVEKAHVYLDSEKNEVFRSEVAEALKNEDYESLYDRFYTALAFGTAGMRGVIGGGTNRINTFMVRKVTQGLAEYCLSVGPDSTVVIAFDSRHYSPEFAKAAALVLSANKVKTYLYDTLHPVPMLSFAVRHMKATAGIVITASHNPAKYNGYKVYWSDGGQVTPPHDIEIAKLANAVTADRIKDISEEESRKSGYLESVPASVDEAYYDMVISSLRRPELVKGSPITVAYTPLHGSGNVPVRHMLSKLGIRCCVVKEQEEPNGAFPTVKLPNPESHEAMSKVIELAKEVKADIVLGTDPDADRLGIYSKDIKTGEYKDFTGNMSALLIAEYRLSQMKEKNILPENGMMVSTIVSSNLGKAIAKNYNLDYRELLVGFKYIGEQIKIEEHKNNGKKYLFGFEESYGCLIGDYARDKDGISAVMSLCEAASYYKSKGLTLWDQMINIYEKYGYYKEGQVSIVLEGSNGAQKMQQIMEKLRNSDISKIGKYKVKEFRDYQKDISKNLETSEISSTNLPKSNVLYYDLENDAWCCVRPSGTEPKIKLYIGVKSNSLKNAEIELENLKKDLELMVKI